MRNNILKFAFFSALATLTQCTSETKNENHEGETDTLAQQSAAPEPFTADEISVFKFDMVLANLPSPMEVLNDLNKSKLNYNPELLTGDKDFNSANSSQQKALFMGAYSIDMSYSINYSQTQPTMNYMASVKKISDDLSISKFYDQSFIDRFERNIEHKDSLMLMSNEVFSLTDKYLRNNDQLKTSVLILAGSWIESIKICSSVVMDSPKSEANIAVYTRLWNQRLNLKQLMDAMEPFKDDVLIKKMIPAFNEILAICSAPTSIDDFTVDQAKAIAEKTQKIHKDLF